MPVSTRIVRPDGSRTAKQRNRSSQEPSAVRASGSNTSASSHCAAVASNASSRGEKNGPEASSSITISMSPARKLTSAS
jgi:hypothetical protein